MKNILVLTTVYPASDLPKTDTPVVHYFAREWIKMGYNVRVVHNVANFPRILYLLAKPFKDVIGAKAGFGILQKKAALDFFNDFFRSVTEGRSDYELIAQEALG